MRILVGLSMTVIAACSGASSSDLFSDAPRVLTEDPSATDPSPSPAPTGDDPAPPDAAPRDAGVKPRDAAAVDAKADAQPDVVVVDASLPEKCTFDSECTALGEICNWQTDTCAAPGPLGAPCKRDLECTDGLCNWKLTTCSEPAPTGTACRRHKECASGACTSSFCE